MEFNLSLEIKISYHEKLTGRIFYKLNPVENENMPNNFCIYSTSRIHLKCLMAFDLILSNVIMALLSGRGGGLIELS